MPLELAVLANGQMHQVRDVYGLSLDPQRYANKKCLLCYGNGTFVKRHNVTKAEVDFHLKSNPGDKLAFTEEEPGKFVWKTNENCGCVEPRRLKRIEEFGEALVKAKLATKLPMRTLFARYELL